MFNAALGKPVVADSEYVDVSAAKSCPRKVYVWGGGGVIGPLASLG
jgi:hypothetical protein